MGSDELVKTPTGLGYTYSCGSFLGVGKILDNISSGSWAEVSIVPFTRSFSISLSIMGLSSEEKLTLGDITG